MEATHRGDRSDLGATKEASVLSEHEPHDENPTLEIATRVECCRESPESSSVSEEKRAEVHFGNNDASRVELLLSGLFCQFKFTQQQKRLTVEF